MVLQTPNSEARCLKALSTSLYKSGVLIAKQAKCQVNTAIKNLNNLRKNGVNIIDDWVSENSIKWKVYKLVKEQSKPISAAENRSKNESIERNWNVKTVAEKVAILKQILSEYPDEKHPQYIAIKDDLKLLENLLKRGQNG